MTVAKIFAFFFQFVRLRKRKRRIGLFEGRRGGHGLNSEQGNDFRMGTLALRGKGRESARAGQHPILGSMVLFAWKPVFCKACMFQGWSFRFPAVFILYFIQW